MGVSNTLKLIFTNNLLGAQFEGGVIKSLVACARACVRSSDDVLGAFSMAKPGTEITDHWLPATQVLRAKCSNTAAIEEESRGS